MTNPATDREAAQWLRGLPAVRERCHAMLTLAEADATPHFSLHPERLESVADTVLKVTRHQYPDGRIPNHSKLHDFDTGGTPRIAHLRADWMLEPPEEQARRLADLLVISVLLDAGAGPQWKWRDTEYHAYPLAEGLALACLNLFAFGGCSSVRGRKTQVDGPGLLALTLPQFTDAMQASVENPLPGLEARWQVLQRLGTLLTEGSPYFPAQGGLPARSGNLVDWLQGRRQAAGHLGLTDLWEALQDGLGAVWPTEGRATLGGLALGDVWPHSALPDEGPGSQRVPFHKLTQWLAHSLLDTLAGAGLALEEQHLLTGLAEYRNGALFIDLGVLAPRDPALLQGLHGPEEEPIVEWRALTVALLDRLADLLRARLGRDATSLTISQVLQGGTWRAGRLLCRKLRPDGEPPIRVRIDGTVF